MRYNICTGKSLFEFRIIDAFQINNVVELKYTIDNKRESDVAAMYTDVSLAKKYCGRQGQLGFKETFTDAWKWQQVL